MSTPRDRLPRPSLASGTALLLLALLGSGCAGESAKACEELCSFGSCDGDTCTHPAGVRFLVYDSERLDVNGASTRVTQAGACAAGRSVVRYEVVESSGACWRLQTTTIEAGPDNSPFDAGTVTMQDGTMGTVELAPQGPCLSADLAPGGAFADGETVRMKATGGADIPALSLQVIAPVTPTVTLSSGDANYLDLKVHWTPSPPPTAIFASTSSGLVYCKPYQDDWLTIPGKMRAEFDGPAGLTDIHVRTVSSVSRDIGSGGKEALFAVLAEKVLTVPDE